MTDNNTQSPSQQNGDNIPSLILVGGAPATGKTTLAHKIAGEIPCPAICKDEIKQAWFTPKVGASLFGEDLFLLEPSGPFIKQCSTYSLLV